VSRLHVGVHHATDVAAGLGVGSLSAAAWRLVHRRWTARATRADHDTLAVARPWRN
jgi:membrane-associated phospholipid phosphatase